MAIVKMKRLHLLALAKEHDAILRKLQHMGCVEISDCLLYTSPSPRD